MLKKRRNAIVAKVHIAKVQLGLDEETYRDVLWRVTGKRSCKDLGVVELMRVLDEMGRLGFRPTGSKGRRPRVAGHRRRVLAKIEAVLGDLGLGWRYAEALARRMFGQSVIEWLSDEQLMGLMQALVVYQRRCKK